MKYLFLYPKTVSRDLFYSQLKPIINFLVDKGNECSVYFGSENKYQILGENYLIVQNPLELNNLLSKIDIVYLRNLYDFFPIYFTKLFYTRNKFKILYNFRGFASYESYYGKKNILKFLLFLSLEFIIYRLSDYVSVVSMEFKQELQRHFGKKKNVSIIPCCVEDVFLKVKRNDNIIKFVFCGSTFKWQKFEEVINLFNKINASYANSQLTLFTKDTFKVKDYLEKIPNKNIKVEYLTRKELLHELRHHDFGMLLRDNVKLNNVASPIKFAEYLSCGLVPILSPGIGDYSSLIDSAKIGILTDSNFDINMSAINDFLLNDDVAIRILEVAKQLTWNKNLHQLPLY